MFGKPPEEVPDDLTAHEYNVLARWYEAEKMQAQARSAYQHQLILEPDGSDAAWAHLALKTRLFDVQVPQSLVKEIALSGFLFMIRPADAKKLALRTVKDYPEYFGGHRLLGQVLLGEFNIEACIDSLNNALRLNPDDVETLVIMARAKCATFEYAAARKFINEASVVSPLNEEVRGLRQTVDFLSGMEDESCPISEQVTVLSKRLRNFRSGQSIAGTSAANQYTAPISAINRE